VKYPGDQPDDLLDHFEEMFYAAGQVGRNLTPQIIKHDPQLGVKGFFLKVRVEFTLGFGDPVDPSQKCLPVQFQLPPVGTDTQNGQTPFQVLVGPGPGPTPDARHGEITVILSIFPF
jgi:hypothetical protein